MAATEKRGKLKELATINRVGGKQTCLSKGTERGGQMLVPGGAVGGY